ncbi:TPA: winged helix-turn-helix domain-containing protein [Raoultella ornithinolytica]
MHRYYIINNIVEFHPTTRQLRNLINPTQMVVLNSPTSRCLLLLIESSNTIVTQQEFMYNVWEKLGLVVSANTYYQNICLLRKGLKEVGFPADPITTIPRIGLTLARETQVQVIESADVLPIANVEESKTEEGARPVHHDTPDSADSDHIGSLRASEPVSGIVAAVPDIPAEQSLNKAGIRKFSKLFFLITALIFSILLADIKVILAQFQGSRYFENYMLAVNTNGCHFFLNKEIHNTDEKAAALTYGNQFKPDCKKFPWVYISRYAMLPRASVIRCNKPMTRPNYCISDYFIEDH